MASTDIPGRRGASASTVPEVDAAIPATLEPDISPVPGTAPRLPQRFTGPAGFAWHLADRSWRILSRLFRAIRSNRKATVGLILLLIITIMAAVPQWIAHDPPQADIYKLTLPPSAAHLFGTNTSGQDLFSQFIWGARETLIIAVASGALSTLLSVLMGVAAAYLGGVWDGGLNFITDVLLVIPTFPLLLIFAAYIPNGGMGSLIVILVVTGYSYGARQLRAQALSMRKRDYLEAARVRGERKLYIICFEMIPTMTPLIVATFLGTAVYNVLFASGLQFIGLGNPNSLSWGTMLYWAQTNEALFVGQYLWAIMPGLGIATLGAAFALLNYAFDEIGNPALRPVRRIRVKRAR